MLLYAALVLALAAPERCVDLLSLADVHGQVARLPRLSAQLQGVRASGRALLLDSGDSLQGTLPAALSRGEAVVVALGAMGVAAAAVGNHDFDYGAAALRQRVESAPFPFLSANLRERATGRPPPWKNLFPSRIFRVPGGPVVGVFGVSAEDTPSLTMPGNVQGLLFTPEAEAAVVEARALRAQGAELVVGLVHGGGRCTDLRDPEDLSSCDRESDLFRLARALPPGLVDALLGGHTHAFVNHRVNGVALVQAGARAEAVGWLTLCAGAPPQFHPPLRAELGAKGTEGDPKVASAIAPFLRAYDASLKQPLGVTLSVPLSRDPARESPLGAATAQAVRAALHTDFGLVNSGGLRADLTPGDLTVGQVFEALPFEDDLAVITLPGSTLLDLVRALASGGKGFPQLAGLVFDGQSARSCAGTPLDPSRTYTLGTNQFLALGGDGTGKVISRLPAGAVKMREGLRMRDALVDWLRRAAPARPPDACP